MWRVVTRTLLLSGSFAQLEGSFWVGSAGLFEALLSLCEHVWYLSPCLEKQGDAD
jgi:hypothetical protein